MARICIVSGMHISQNPRVYKEATALSAVGHEVTVVAPALSPKLIEADARLLAGVRWRYETPVDLTRSGLRKLAVLFWKSRTRLSQALVRRLDVQLRGALGYGLSAMTRAVRKKRSELYIVHMEVGSVIGVRLLSDGFRVASDFEDWYSEDLSQEARASRPLELLRETERKLLTQSAYSSTTSLALSDALAATYRSRRPLVLYNAFPLSDRLKVRRELPRSSRPSLYWVSQTIGGGRGLETLMEALAMVKVPLDVHLRGTVSADSERALRSAFPSQLGHALLIHAPVDPSDMLAAMSQHDVGLALEPTSPPNKDLTISNKILHYLLAGLAVVATATKGQAEVAAKAPGAVSLCESGDAQGLAEQLSRMVADPVHLNAAKESALRAAEEFFCWENQVPSLLSAVDASLA